MPSGVLSAWACRQPMTSAQLTLHTPPWVRWHRPGGAPQAAPLAGPRNCWEGGLGSQAQAQRAGGPSPGFLAQGRWGPHLGRGILLFEVPYHSQHEPIQTLKPWIGVAGRRARSWAAAGGRTALEGMFELDDAASFGAHRDKSWDDKGLLQLVPAQR